MPSPPRIFQRDLPEDQHLIGTHANTTSILKKMKSQKGRRPPMQKRFVCEILEHLPTCKLI